MDEIRNYRESLTPPQTNMYVLDGWRTATGNKAQRKTRTAGQHRKRSWKIPNQVTKGKKPNPNHWQNQRLSQIHTPRNVESTEKYKYLYVFDLPISCWRCNLTHENISRDAERLYDVVMQRMVRDVRLDCSRNLFKSARIRHGQKMQSASLSLCDRNPPITSGLMIGNVELCFFFVALGTLLSKKSCCRCDFSLTLTAFYPGPVLAFGYCRCLRVCVCPCVRQSWPSVNHDHTIDHHGPSIYSGHYTTSVNCCNRTFYCNDNKITEFDMINTKNSSTAYVVIY